MKTGNDVIAADKFFKLGLSRILLLLPSSGMPQFFDHDLAFWRARIDIKVPFFSLGGNVPISGRKWLVSNRLPGCYVLPYGVLQSPSADGMIEQLSPDAIIADEAHRLSDEDATSTGRILRYLRDQREAGRGVRFVPQSGTIAGTSIKQYAHLLLASLHHNCPMPIKRELVEAWCRILDARTEATAANSQPFLPLVDWARGKFPLEQFSDDQEGFRKAYKLRFISAPGVVSTGDAELKCSLRIVNKPVPEPDKVAGHDEVLRLMDQVDDNLTPNGDIIEHAMQKFKWWYELTAGFYYKLVWPTPADLALRHSLPAELAERRLEGAKAHHRAGQVCAGLMKKWLQAFARTGLDSPFLVASSMARHGRAEVEDDDLYDAWRAKKDLEFDGMPERDQLPVRVCGYKVDHAAALCENLPKHEGAIVWYWHNEVGRWLCEVLSKKFGQARVVHAPAGADEVAINQEHAGKFMVTSLGAHGEVKNMQHFGHEVFVQWPRAAKLAQQSLGRAHRNGQARHEVVAWSCATTGFDHDCLAATLNDALYVHQTSAERQRLVYARFEPLPIVRDSAWLREHGYANKLLSTDQQAALQEIYQRSP